MNFNKYPEELFFLILALISLLIGLQFHQIISYLTGNSKKISHFPSKALIMLGICILAGMLVYSAYCSGIG